MGHPPRHHPGQCVPRAPQSGGGQELDVPVVKHEACLPQGGEPARSAAGAGARDSRGPRPERPLPQGVQARRRRSDEAHQ
eukprot:8644934-Prorocentrum_lima.AAC.1